MPTGTPIPEETIREAVREVERGSTWAAAAKTYGISHATLRRRAQDLRIGPRRGRALFASPLRLTIPTDPTDLAYLAGIIDGEGWITVTHGAASARGPRIVVRLGVTNTATLLIEWLRVIGGSVSQRTPEGWGRKPIYAWQITGRRDALALLEAIEPYLRIKRDRAKDGIAILREAMGLHEAWLEASA